MLTLDHILNEVRRVKTCSRAQLYRYLSTFNIQPLGARQRPQLYPKDSGLKILQGLGLIQPAKVEKSKLPSMAQLRNERRKGGRK